MENIDQTYIKLYRKISNWDWYTDPNTKSLFIHLIIFANIKTKKWKGVTIHRGELLTSISKLATANGLTVQETRTSIKKLLSTNEITKRTTSNYTLITVLNYDLYQDSNKENNKHATKYQQGSNKVATTTKEFKELKELNTNTKKRNIKEKKVSDFGLDQSVQNAFDDFVEMRKQIKKPVTDAAIKLIINKLQKMSNSADEQIQILNQSTEHCWQSIYPIQENSIANGKNAKKTLLNKNGDNWDEWMDSFDK